MDEFDMVPNGELGFGLEFGVDVGDFGGDKGIKWVESGFEDTDLEEDNGDFL